MWSCFPTCALSSFPRAPCCCHAGARLGLASEVRDRLRVAWVDPDDPSKGVGYLYLSEADYTALTEMGARQQQGKDALGGLACDHPCPCHSLSVSFSWLVDWASPAV